MCFVLLTRSLPCPGIDLVSVNDDGKITDFKVMARPPNAVAALKDEMMRKVPTRLATLKLKQAARGIFS